jgi:hypothetical protein
MLMALHEERWDDNSERTLKRVGPSVKGSLLQLPPQTAFVAVINVSDV